MALTFLKEFSGLTEHRFYKGQELLLFDAKKHEYYLAENNGLTLIPGCSTVCKILDKSEVLLNWAVKVVTDKMLVLSQPYIHKTPGISVDYWIPVDEYEELIKTAKKAHKDKLEDASNIGKLAHNWIEAFIGYEINSSQGIPYIPMPENEQAASCCRAAVTWMRNHNVRWVSTEQKIYSRKYRYAGTLDGLCFADSCTDNTCCKSVFRDALTLADWKTSNALYPEFLLQTAAYQQAYSEEHGVHISHRWVIRLGKEDAEFEPWHIDSIEDYNQDLKAFLDALELTNSIKAVKDRLKEIEDEAKAIRKAAKKEATEKALTLKCKGADKYQGKRRPKCNNNNPCQACTTKYQELHKGQE